MRALALRWVAVASLAGTSCFPRVVVRDAASDATNEEARVDEAGLDADDVRTDAARAETLDASETPDALDARDAPDGLVAPDVPDALVAPDALDALVAPDALDARSDAADASTADGPSPDRGEVGAPVGCEGRGDGTLLLDGNGLRQLALGLQYGCAIAGVEQRVFCWGTAYRGERGGGESSEELTAPLRWLSAEGGAVLRGFVRIAAGNSHACALQADGALWCWGGNFANDDSTMIDGRVGLLDRAVVPPQVALRDVRAFAVGSRHTCVVRSGEADVVRCFGDNSEGQLGTPTVPAGSTTPPLGHAHEFRLPEAVCSVVAGADFGCALTASGAVWCWGSGEHGVTGRLSGATTREPPRQVAGLEDVRVLRAGGEFACALDGAGAVRCWGQNFSGQLGRSLAASEGARPQLVALGGRVADQLGLGRQFACARDRATREVVCWGSNDQGELGQGTTSGPTPSGSRFVVGAGPRLADAAAPMPALADSFSSAGANVISLCVLRAGERPLCWGSNQGGILGFDMTASMPTVRGPIAHSIGPPTP